MLVVKCDLCKVAISEDMKVLEVKLGKAGDKNPTEGLAAHVCDECWRTLDAGAFIHKFRSMGATDLVRALAQQAQARPQLAGPDAPVPVDPKLLARMQGR